MWANAPLRPARASTARQHRERPRPTPPLSRLGGRCPLSTASGRHPSSHRPRSRRTPSAAIRLSPGTSRHCGSGGIPCLRGQRCETPFSRSGYVQHSVTNHPTAGLSIPVNPPRVSVQHRRSLPATPGRERLAPLSAEPNQWCAVDCVLLITLRRPSATPTRRSTTSASPRPCRARRRAARPRSARSTRPPGTSACRSSPCMSCPGREQLVVDPALGQGLSSLRFSARISPSSS